MFETSAMDSSPFMAAKIYEQKGSPDRFHRLVVLTLDMLVIFRQLDQSEERSRAPVINQSIPVLDGGLPPSLSFL